MRRQILAPVCVAVALGLTASGAHAQLRLAPPTLRLAPAPQIAGAPAPLHFRAPWELPTSDRRAALATPDSSRARGPAAPGACRMPVLGPLEGGPRDEMPVLGPDGAGTGPRMRVAAPRACAPAT